MKLQPGDKVKFLNTTGGGVVTKVLDSRMVLVADEDGFEVPTLISELVKIDPSDAGGRFFKEDFSTPVPVKQGKDQLPDQHEDQGNRTREEEEPGPDYLPPAVIRKRTSEDIFLAFVPHDQKWLITGSVDVFLINNTSYDVIYNLFHRTGPGHYTGVDYGSLFAGTRHLLATINRELLPHWTDGSLQFLFHKEQLEEVIPPFNSEFQIDGTKFLNEGSYRESTLVNARGIIIRIISLTRYLEENRPVPKDTPPPLLQDSRSIGKTEPPLIFHHQTEPRKAVVDLHIHELIEDPSNLQQAEILEFQKKYFIRCLDGARTHHFLKVVFIHGVGNGILRTVLIDHLKKTEGIEWFDAPMFAYGVGALEVSIPHNL
ncbi:MAG: DUF2027 domain-containing protein [Bacteroidetes bacterium]|nr:MAG: DUF2027 domain-containing protein [Bacteroidota bacterium]